MATGQPGIFAQGTRSHYNLEFDLRPGAGTADVVAAVAQLREPTVTAGGFNLVIGFGADLWSRLSPAGAQPAELRPFDAVEGRDGHRAPATQHDIWIWIHGTGRTSRWTRRGRARRSSRRSRRSRSSRRASSTGTAAT